MKILIVGDVHLDNENILECSSLFDLIYETTQKYKPDFVLHLGDDLDGFSYPSVKAQHFLTEYAQKIEQICPIVFIVGNHSQSPNDEDKHSLLPLKFLKNTTVVDRPASFKGFDFMPFRRNKFQFEKEVNSLSNDILFCHQPFAGAVYETGWEDRDGLDVNKVKHSLIISGHIHASSNLEKCWYPGSPRYMKKSDANEVKFIYLWDSVSKETFNISTWPSVKRFKEIELNEQDVIPEFDEINTKYYVTLKGSLDFCQKTSMIIGDKAEIKTMITKQKKSQFKKQSTVELSLKEYLNNNYKMTSDISKEILIKEISNRLFK